MLNSDEIFDSVEGLFDFDDEDVGQTDVDETGNDDAEESSADADNSEETEQEAQDAPEDDDSSEGDADDNSDSEAAETEDKPDDGNTKPSFENLKVNGEIRSCTYEEAPAWIQKGMDYDRVKGQLETERQANHSLQETVDKQKPYMEMLEGAAESSGVTVEQLVEAIQVNLRMSRDGLTEKEARAVIRAENAERKVEALSKKQEPPKSAEAEPDNRAEREVAEFARNFPGVQLTDEQIEAMRPDVQNGMSMTNAYLKTENDRLKAEIEAQKRQQEAAAKNRKNRARSPGSQKDSGGGKTEDLADIFEKELFK